MAPLLHLLHRGRCLLSYHQWEPNHIQVWIAPSFNLAAYKDAKCKRCELEAGQVTVFSLQNIEPSHVLGKFSPFQVTDDSIVWFIPGYDPPSRTDLMKYGNSLL